MRLIFGDDWNDTPRSLRLFGNDVISLDFGSLMIFVHLYTCTQSIQKQIVEYDIKMPTTADFRLRPQRGVAL